VFVDAHCHLDLPAFDADRLRVIERARAVGVTGFLVAGVDPPGWIRQRALAASTPGVRWAAGLHPWKAAHADAPAHADEVAALAACFEGDAAACGVGETGLDAHFVPTQTLDRQALWLGVHLRLARDLGRPLVLHVVRAHGRALDELRPFAPICGMVHAFGGGPELAREYLRLGLHLSFAGPFVRSKRARRAAMIVPADRPLVETDAPDQPPPGVVGRGEPAELVRVAKALAGVRNEPPEMLLRRSAEQVVELFGEGEPWTA